MDSEKKFANEMFGYSKQEVEEYIKDIKAEYESRLQAEKSDSNRLSNELTIVKKKLERYEIDYVERQEKVANALITAEDQSKKIIENARIEANEERERIEHLIEMEKEKLLDLKKEVIDLKERTIRLMDKYSSDMNSLLD
jgi:cell division septum initiation protein DivIVA